MKDRLAAKPSLVRENSSLKEQAALMALELSRMSEIVKENARLRGLAGFSKSLPYKSVLAEVIGRAPSSWSRVMIINKGARHGIKKHMAVCASKGLVGTIAETGIYTSKVMLLADPNSRIGVTLGETRQSGVLVGVGGYACKIIYLGMDEEVKIGEPVLTSGFGEFLPKGINIGSVKDVGIDKIGFYTFAVIELSQDPNSVEEVLCIE